LRRLGRKRRNIKEEEKEFTEGGRSETQEEDILWSVDPERKKEDLMYLEGKKSRAGLQKIFSMLESVKRRRKVRYRKGNENAAHVERSQGMGRKGHTIRFRQTTRALSISVELTRTKKCRRRGLLARGEEKGETDASGNRLAGFRKSSYRKGEKMTSRS